jgi:hypothetical protein
MEQIGMGVIICSSLTHDFTCNEYERCFIINSLPLEGKGLLTNPLKLCG